MSQEGSSRASKPESSAPWTNSGRIFHKASWLWKIRRSGLALDWLLAVLKTQAKQAVVGPDGG